MSREEMKLVPAVERAAKILDIVARHRAFPTVSDLARELNLPKSSVHTLCRTLLELNLLIRRSDQSYQLGPHLMRWSNAFTKQSDVAAEFATMWDSEAEIPGATIVLSFLEGNEMVYMAARNSDTCRPLMDIRAGMRLPAAFSASGKAFLSRLSEFEVKQLYPDGMPAPRTPHSVRTMDALLREMRVTRQNGYSVDNQQTAEGVICFGAPVLDSRNDPIAAVAVSFLVEELTDAQKERIISDVKSMALRLSIRMGADIGTSRLQPHIARPQDAIREPQVARAPRKPAKPRKGRSLAI